MRMKTEKISQVHLLHIVFLSEAIKWRRRTRMKKGESNDKRRKNLFPPRVSINKNSHVFASSQKWWLLIWKLLRKTSAEKRKKKAAKLLWFVSPPLVCNMWACKSMKFHCPVGWQMQKWQSLSDLNAAITYIYSPNLSRRLFRVQSAFAFIQTNETPTCDIPRHFKSILARNMKASDGTTSKTSVTFNWNFESTDQLCSGQNLSISSHVFKAYHEVYFIFIRSLSLSLPLPFNFSLLHFMNAVNSHLTRKARNEWKSHFKTLQTILWTLRKVKWLKFFKKPTI